jgi:7-cyano-7-deazaguanine synthase
MTEMTATIGKELLDDVLNKLPELEDGKNVCLSYSGGYDSTITLYLLVHKYGAERVKTLSFDYKQKHNIELEKAKINVEKLGVEHRVIDMGYLYDIIKDNSALASGSDIEVPTVNEVSGDPQPLSYVAFRNLQMMSITAAYAETHQCSYIVLSNNATDLYGYYDATPEFTERLNKVFELNRKNQITMISPFSEMYKVDEGEIALELTDIYGYDIIENHWSCYNGDSGDGKECGLVGNCPTCREKMVGMFQAGYSKEYIMNRFKGSSEDFDILFGSL